MSVRSLHRIPCPVCKEDTLHQRMKCLTCGNTQLTSYEVITQTRAHRARRLIAAGCPKPLLNERLNAYKRPAEIARTKEQRELPMRRESVSTFSGPRYRTHK